MSENNLNYPAAETICICYSGDGVRHEVSIGPDQCVGSGQPNMIYSDDMLEFAGLADEAGVAQWSEMPDIGETVTRGVYTYGDQVVAVYQDHTRQEDWTIEGTPSLYGVYHGTGTEIAEWVQPTGAHDAYQIGDEVLFGGVQYRSVINDNVWSPTGYPAGWEQFE